MKAKIYIPIIIAAGAAAGLALGLTNMSSGGKKDQVVEQTTSALETTLSKEELAKIEEQKEKEYEEKVREEEENAEKYFKKRQEEKEKKAEEEKKKAEEEQKKKEEEEKKKTEESKEEKEEDSEKNTDKETDDEENVVYEYIYVPLNNNTDTTASSDNTGKTETKPATQHRHSWEAVYKTVHHDAKTHNERRKTGTVQYIICKYYGEDYFTLITENVPDSFYQVCKLPNGNIVFETNKEYEKKDIDYFMSIMSISYYDPTYEFTTRDEDVFEDVTVIDTDAYDERVFDYYECTGCGEKSY